MTTNVNINSKDAQRAAFEYMYQQALAYKQNKDYIKAIDTYNKIISKRKDIENCMECAMLYEDIGNIYFDLKDYSHAFEYMQKALQVYVDNKNDELQLEQTKKIGSLQQNIYQFKKAADVFHQGLSLATRLGRKDWILDFELLLGNVYNWMDDLPLAEKYLVSTIAKEKKNKHPLIRLRACVSYAILLRKMKEYDASAKYFKIGRKLSLENESYLITDITRSFGILQLEVGNYKEAEYLLLEAEKNALLEDSPTKKTVVFQYLAELYKRENNFEKAYFYITQHFELRQKLLEDGYTEDNNVLQIKLGLEDAKRERLIAEETANAKSLFIATISHEIRTPMNIILGTTSLMLNDEPKTEHVKYLQTLKKSGENLLGIINDILDVSKIEAGKLEMEYEPVLLSEIFDNILTVLEQSAKDKNLNLFYVIDKKITTAFQSDALRLTQIITNLIGNAIKFTTKGSIKLEAKLSTKDSMQITVTDTGIGIPKNKLKTVFEQYEQVRTNLNKKYKGTGLGLSISRKLVELMHGTIEVKSKLKVGTEFKVILPFEKSKQQKNKIAVLSKDAEFLKNKTILIVDDFDDNRFVISETLKFFNKEINILEAIHGKDALEKLKDNAVDFVIMDLDMPEMNGFEALKIIRKNKQLKHLKVVASTASLITNGEEEFIELGFDGYLPKPFNIDSFFLLLEKIMK